MGRPSVAAERRQQIIAAAIQCMAVHGATGTTLERIAETAGMARGHIRHFTGNRDELLTDAARVFYFGEEAIDATDLDEAARRGTLIPLDRSGVAGALDYLFGDFAAPGIENAAAVAFVAEGRSNPRIRDTVLRAYLGMQDRLRELLAAEHAAASASALDAAAYSILTVALGHVFVNDIQFSAERTSVARAAAEQLVAGLGEG